MAIKVLFHAAKGLAYSCSAATRLYSSSAVLSKRFLVTKDEASQLGIHLTKNIFLRCEGGAHIDIKDGKIKGLLHAAADYQRALLDSYGAEDLFNGCGCDRPLDPFEIHCAELACQKAKDLYSRVCSEAGKINMKVDC